MVSIGDRMKTYYENCSKSYLTRRTPVIIRIDGKSFHTVTKGFNKPFDELFIKTMQETTLFLCKQIEGCKFGYVQSDEISLLLTDYDTLSTDAWFSYSIQKLCSISASMTTITFYKTFCKLYNEMKESIPLKQQIAYEKVISKGATFDSRCFNIPKEEISNYFIWRQQDATRNSILGMGQKYFKQSELQNKKCNDVQEMLFTKEGINWNDLPIVYKRGTSCYREEIPIDNDKIKHNWVLDYQMPILTLDTNYISNKLP